MKKFIDVPYRCSSFPHIFSPWLFEFLQNLGLCGGGGGIVNSLFHKPISILVLGM